MLKIILCMKRRPEMSRAEFVRYWKEDHVKVMAEVGGVMGIRRNVHNYTIATPIDERLRQGRGTEMDDYDGVAESWFDSLEALTAATSTDEGRRAAQLLAEDEARFIDFSRSRIFFVEENVVVGERSRMRRSRVGKATRPPKLNERKRKRASPSRAKR
jgi:uncharacterized protein (TIGR02118 family)